MRSSLAFVCALLVGAQAYAACLPKDFAPFEAMALRDFSDCSDNDIERALEQMEEILRSVEKNVAKWRKENPDSDGDTKLSTYLSLGGAARTLRMELVLTQERREAEQKEKAEKAEKAEKKIP